MARANKTKQKQARRKTQRKDEGSYPQGNFLQAKHLHGASMASGLIVYEQWDYRDAAMAGVAWKMSAQSMALYVILWFCDSVVLCDLLNKSVTMLGEFQTTNDNQFFFLSRISENTSDLGHWNNILFLFDLSVNYDHCHL